MYKIILRVLFVLNKKIGGRIVLVSPKMPKTRKTNHDLVQSFILFPED